MRRGCWIAIIIVLTLLVDAKSQSITNTITTESRCTATGTITVTATGGTAPYQYATISGPTIKPNQSANVLTSLAPGTYTVRVTDNLGATATKTGVVVAGSYTLMSPSSVQTTPFCPGGSDGKITVTISSTTGRAPYSFQLIAPSPVTTAVITPGTNSYTFTNLPAGAYTYQTTDSCGNFQTRNVTLNNPSPATLGVNHNNDFYFQKTTCDSVDLYSMQVWGGTAPFQLQVFLNGVVSPATTLTSAKFTVGTGFIMRVPYTAVAGGTHSFRVTDTCGQVYNNTFTTHFITLQPAAIPTTCNPLKDFSWNIKGLKGPITLNLYNGTGTGGTIYSTITLPGGIPLNANGRLSGVFPEVPTGTYTLQAIDSCGTILTATTSITNKVPKTISYNFDKTINVLDSTTTVAFTSNQFLNKPVKFTWLSGPAVYTSAVNKFSGTRIYPYVDSFLVSDNIFPFSNVPMGTYKVAVVDSCGWTDTLNFTVGSSNVQTMNFLDSIQPGCINDNKIFARVTSGTAPAYSAIYLHRIISPGLNTLVASSSSSNTAIFSYTFNGVLSFTDYIVSYEYSSSLKKLFGNSSIARRDTLHTLLYSPPTITSGLPVACPGTTTGSLTINANGVPPYQYAIIAGATTRPNQASNIFTGLPTSTTPYTIRVTDACTNSNTNDFSLSPVASPSVNTSVPCVNIGMPVTFSADTVNATTYNWTKPDGSTYNGRSFIIPAVSSADTGVYTLTATTFGCAVAITKTVHLQTCSVLPLHLLDFTAKLSGSIVQLQWITSDEINMDKFIIERSENGRDWISIGSLPVRNNTGTKETYTFNDNINNNTLAFYRIKIIENSGTYSYSSIAKIFQTGNTKSTILYPNPATESVTISLGGYKSTATGQLYNSTGQLERKIKLSNGTNTMNVVNLPIGVHHLKITDEEGNQISYKILVSH